MRLWPKEALARSRRYEQLDPRAASGLTPYLGASTLLGLTFVDVCHSTLPACSPREGCVGCERIPIDHRRSQHNVVCNMDIPHSSPTRNVCLEFRQASATATFHRSCAGSDQLSRQGDAGKRTTSSPSFHAARRLPFALMQKYGTGRVNPRRGIDDLRFDSLRCPGPG